MFCDKCGSKIPNGSIFCTSCGAKLAVQDSKKSKGVFTQNDAQKELEKANEAAASIIESANAEASKVAKEFSEAAKENDRVNKEFVSGLKETSMANNEINAAVNQEAAENITNETNGAAVADTDAASVNTTESDIPEKTDSGLEVLAGSEQQLPIISDTQAGENVPTVSETGEAAIDVQQTAENIPVPAQTGEIIPAATEGQEGNVPAVADNNTAKPVKVEKKPSGEIKEGKSIPAGLIIVASLGLIVVVIALVFLISGSARNSVKKMFLSDENYFKSVERNAISELIDDLGTAYEDDFVGFFDFMKSKYSVDIDIDVKDEAEDFLEAIYKKNRDYDLSWIKKGDVTASIQMKDKMLQFEGNVNVNKKDIANFDIIGNLNENKYYAGIPILSKEYAKVDYSSVLDLETMNFGSAKGINFLNLISSTDFQDALPSKKEVSRILLKYLDIALDKLKRIKFYEDQALEASGVKERYLMISAELDESLQPEIIDAVLKELSKDDDVLAIINRIEKTGVFGDRISADSFLDWIEEEQNKVYEKDYTFKTLNIWVDNTGKVVGQQIIDDDGTGYTYKYVINGNNFGFVLFETKRNKVMQNLTASGTVSGNSVTGNLKYFTKNGVEKFSVDFSDIDVVDLLCGNPTGSIIIDIYEYTGERQFKGLKATVEFDLSLKKSTAKVLLSDAGKTIIEDDITLKKSSAGTVKEPSKIQEIDKNNGLMTWVKNFDWDTVLKNADKINMPSRYTRQIQKWSEADAETLFAPLKDLLNKLGLRSLQLDIFE